TRPVRPRGARPAALEATEAVRVRRFHLPDRGPAAAEGAHGEAPARRGAEARRVGARLPVHERALSPPRAARARAQRPIALARPRARPDAERREAPLVGRSPGS